MPIRRQLPDPRDEPLGWLGCLEILRHGRRDDEAREEVLKLVARSEQCTLPSPEPV